MCWGEPLTPEKSNCLLAIEVQGLSFRRLVRTGEQHSVLIPRAIPVLVGQPTRNDEDILFLPLERLPTNLSRATATNDMADHTRGLAAGTPDKAWPEPLDPAADRRHDRAAHPQGWCTRAHAVVSLPTASSAIAANARSVSAHG